MEVTAVMFSPLILMDISMTHFLMTQELTAVLSWLTHLILAQWVNSFITLFPHVSYHSHDESNVLPYCHPCSLLRLLFLCHIIIFPVAVLLCLLRLHVMTHFLAHFILQAGRIFWQWHCNCIVCLVVETALHGYKAISAHGWDNSSLVFIGFNLASVTVKSSTQPPWLHLLWCQNFWTLLTFLHHHLLT